jgi:murein DD-endopeptidase MepM/ murein hydrolase activator NlpD
MDKHWQLSSYLTKHPDAISKVVAFNPTVDKFFQFNFTETNTALSGADVADTEKFSHYINNQLELHNCRLGIGGYMEHRTIYQRSILFDDYEEPRTLHLGVDIWGPTGTHVYAPLAGKIHSFQDNNHFGDYGPTIILEHDLDGLILYSLYGHLSRASLTGLKIGHGIESGQKIAELGQADENGDWPPHLHFQLMFDLQGMSGDYPGVGKFSEKETLILNIPDPNLILQIPAATIVA